MNLNPFEVKGDWYKGNIHVHTNESDGSLSPEKVVNCYRENGYKFLAITDHEKATEVSNLCSTNFLVFSGTEIQPIDSPEIGSHYHLVILGLNKRDYRQIIELFKNKPMKKMMNLIYEMGGMVILAHPYINTLTMQDILSIPYLLGIEICNTCVLFNKQANGKGLSEFYWDELLTRGRKIFGFAVDDAHDHYGESRNGHIVVKAKELTEEAILNSIKKGFFYSSFGPEIKDIKIEGKFISVYSSPAVSINFMGLWNKGRAFTAKEGEFINKAKYRLNGTEKYIRIRVRDSQGRYAWTNPMFIIN